MSTLYGVILIAAAYFLGSLDFGYIIGRIFFKDDIRNYGSGNAGTNNVLRTWGSKYAVPVLIFDSLKGAVIILLGKYLSSNGLINEWFIAFGGIAVVCGHNWSIFLKGRGGKGAATSLGVMLALDWRSALVGIVIGLILLFTFKIMSVVSMVGIGIQPFVQLILHGAVFTPALLLTIFLAVCILIQHRSNIVRLANGTESKVGHQVDTSKKKE